MKRTNTFAWLFFLLSASLLSIWVLWLSSFLLDDAVFKSYFVSPVVLFLNAGVVVLPYLLLWCIFGRLRPAFFIASLGASTLALAASLKFYFREEPFSFADFELIRPMLGIAPHYLKEAPWWSFVGVGAFFVLLIAVTFKAPQGRIKPLKGIVGGVLLIGVMTGLLFGPYRSYDIYINYPKESTHNLFLVNEAYKAHGAPYTFVYNLQFFRAEHYDKDLVEEALSPYHTKAMAEDKRPDIIVYQIESYKDFSKLDSNIRWIIDPYQDWHALQEEGAKGAIVARVYGGGTITTETAVSIGALGGGALNRKRESVVTYLKSQGYRTEGMHPNTPSFYNRGCIYDYLGYDVLLSTENLFYNDLSTFMEDEKVIPFLQERLDNSPSPYFCHVIGIEGHGAYETYGLLGKAYFEKPASMSDADYNYLNNYLYHGEASTKAIKNFLEANRKSKRPLIFLAYGDHSPKITDAMYEALDLSTAPEGERLLNERYETPLLIWANEEAKKMLGDPEALHDDWGKLEPAFLLPTLFQRLDLGGSVYMQYAGDFAQDISVIREGLVYKNGSYHLSEEEDKNRIKRLQHVESYRKKQKYTQED